MILTKELEARKQKRKRKKGEKMRKKRAEIWSNLLWYHVNVIRIKKRKRKKENKKRMSNNNLLKGLLIVF